MTEVSKTLEERGSRYGAFADHAKIAQGLQDVLRAAPKWDFLDYDMKQALSVMCDKFARILNGDPYYLDNWHDVQGYAALIENRLKMLETAPGTLYPTRDEVHQDRPYIIGEHSPEEFRYPTSTPITDGGVIRS